MGKRVFVSWSRDQSRAVARSLKTWLPCVFNGLDVWMSEQDIHAGAQWAPELERALSGCRLGILCLTQESLQSRWMTFEAGALSATIRGSRVVPYRYKVSEAEVSPPLSQFQGVQADREGTFRLVQSINQAFPKPWHNTDLLGRTFDVWWPDLKKELDRVGGITPTQARTDREMLEEILDLARQAGLRDLSAILIRLFSSPNIRRVEVAQKQVDGKGTDRIALRITVVKKLPMALIPRDQLIPASIFGMATDVVEEPTVASAASGGKKGRVRPLLEEKRARRSGKA